MIKTFKADKDGYIKFTEKQLKELLDEVYNEGKREGKMFTWNSPYIYCATNASNITGTNSYEPNLSATTFTFSSTDTEDINKTK